MESIEGSLILILIGEASFLTLIGEAGFLILIGGAYFLILFVAKEDTQILESLGSFF